MPRALSWRAASSSSRSRRLRLATRAISALPGFRFAILLLGTSTYAYVKTVDKPVFTWRDVNVPKCQNRAETDRAWAEAGIHPRLGEVGMKATRVSLRSGAALLLLAGMPMAAWAQHEAPPATENAVEEEDEQNIIVTAQRREERLTDVGISITALPERLIEETRITQIENIATAVPNVDIKEQVPGAIPVVTIRGIGLDDFSATNSPSAGVYVDEVPLASTALMSSEIYDLERIEVLKGPQGTLYGRNSTAGALNIITARPGNEFAARFSAGYGNFETFDAEGFV